MTDTQNDLCVQYILAIMKKLRKTKGFYSFNREKEKKEKKKEKLGLYIFPPAVLPKFLKLEIEIQVVLI